LRVVREEEPPRPSLKLSTAEARASISANRGSEPLQLSTMMQGEIDWIVMKALEKDRTRRYDSAVALAKDVQRYLTGDAVEACPPTLGYRMRKFLNKNRTAVRVAIAFICLGAGAIAMGAFLAVQARRAEVDASQKRIEAVENAKRADEAANTAEYFRLLSDGRADRLDLELENSKKDAASLQVDIDLAELRDDAKVGLLRLSRNVQAIDTSAINRNEYLNSDLFDERYAELVSQKKALSEFVTAAVLTTGQNYAPLLPPLTHEGGAVQTCELSSDARVVMTLGYDGTVRLWDSTTAQAVATLREQDELVLVCKFSPDGRTAITDDMFGVARIWDATTGRLRAKTIARPERYQYPSDWTYARIASAGRRLGWGSQNIQTENNRLLTTGATFEAPGDGEKFDRFEYSSLSDLWDTNTGKWIAKFDNQIRLVGGGKYVVVLEEESQAAIYSAEDGGLLKRLVCNSIDQIAASPSGRRIAIKTDVLRVWDTNTWTEYVPAAPTVTKSIYSGALTMLWDPAMQSIAKTRNGNWHSLMLLSDRTAATIGYDVDDIYNTVWNIGDGKNAIDDQTGGTGPDLACLDDGRLFDSRTGKRLIPPAGRKFHPDLVHFAGDQRFVVFTQSSSTLGLPAWIDTQTDKACPGSGSWQHRNGYGMVQAFLPYNQLSEPELGQVHIIPTSWLDIPPALLELWAQVAVCGELGPDGEFVKWIEKTWEQKRQELAAAKPPYEDFPFPGYVATDKLHWLRAEYETVEDDKEKLMLVNELLSRSEKIGDENESVRWRAERAKYVNEPAPMPMEEKAP
jgi:WD40 repeat protein